MKMYFYVNNLYMNQKQWGIQSVHILGEMIAQYARCGIGSHGWRMFQDVIEWADEHKTVIMLEGTCSGVLAEIYEHIKDAPYPVAKFHEDEFSLGGALTAVGIVLTEDMCQVVDALREYRGEILRENLEIEMDRSITEGDFNLAMFISKGRLA